MARNTTRDVTSLGAQWDHARQIADEALSLLARAALPVGSPERWVVIAALALIALTAGGRARRLPAADPVRHELRRWLAVAGAGAIAIVAGYAAFVPGAEHYQPLNPGLHNRMNALASLGLATLLVAIASLAATLILGRRPEARRLSAGAVAVAGLALGTGYVLKIDDDKRAYARASETQRDVLAAIERLPPPAAGTKIYAFGAPVYASPGVPVFRHWDMPGAVRLALERSTIAAYPIYPDAAFECAAASMGPRSRSYGAAQRSTYGRGLLLDVSSGRAAIPRNRAECLAERGRFRSGPWVAGR